MFIIFLSRVILNLEISGRGTYFTKEVDSGRNPRIKQSQLKRSGGFFKRRIQGSENSQKKDLGKSQSA
jgi:hypothetical protein